MSKLPDVYYITINNGWGVIKNAEGSYSPAFEEYTMFSEDDIDQEIINVESAFETKATSNVFDEEYIRTIGKNFMHGLQKIGEYDEVYTPKVINGLVDCLKAERDSLKRLEEALKPISNLKKEDNYMSEEKKDVAVTFYEGFISKKPVFKKKGESTIRLTRVKMPNDDPNDKQDKRSFLVNSAFIQESDSNKHDRYVYLKPDVEYKVVRHHYNKDTKEESFTDECKMTGQAIADTFKAERDRKYTEWKENQKQNNPFEEEPEALAQSEPEYVNDDDGIAM